MSPAKAFKMGLPEASGNKQHIPGSPANTLVSGLAKEQDGTGGRPALLREGVLHSSLEELQAAQRNMKWNSF